ncbi:MAG: M15 family metallopeptidase [Bacteroidales bacterium]|nr:M15 family metallopeptidase [Bacteroidales bacterium]
MNCISIVASKILLIILLGIFICCGQKVAEKKFLVPTQNKERSSPRQNQIVNDSIKIEKKYLLGKVSENDSVFVKIPKEYCLYREEFLHKSVIDNYLEMFEAAKNDSVSLKILSALRTFDVQKWLWEKKFTSTKDTLNLVKEILNFSSMPGTSRHHWGTDFDVCSVELNWWNNSTEGTKTYKWLQENAHKFGFYQPFTAGRKTGYFEEKWHWSYKPLAIIYLEQYANIISYKDIFGFKGSNFAKQANVIENYVFGINPELTK